MSACMYTLLYNNVCVIVTEQGGRTERVGSARFRSSLTYCCSPLLGTGRSYVSSIFGAIVIPVASLARCRKKRSFTQLESLPGFFFIRIPCTGISKQTLLNEFWTLCGWFMGGSRRGELGTRAEQKEVSKKMARLGLCVCGGSKGERLS